MRRTSGNGSDVDETNETLRERENAARKRRGDTDNVLLGLTLMQRAGHATLTGDRARLTAALRDGRGGAMMMMMTKNDIRAQRFGRGGGDAGRRLLTELAMMTIKSCVRKRRLVHMTAPMMMMIKTHIQSQRFGRGSGDAGRRLLTELVTMMIQNSIRTRRLRGGGGAPCAARRTIAAQRAVAAAASGDASPVTAGTLQSAAPVCGTQTASPATRT
jgi:hypothetical protein